MTYNCRKSFLVPAEAARSLEQYVTAYCRENFDPELCQSERHVLVKAIAVNVQSYIIRDLGNIARYWDLMFAALKYWFKPGDESYEVKVFSSMIECSGAMLDQADSKDLAEFDVVYREYRHWRGRPLKCWLLH